MFLTVMGRVEIENCRALKMERTVKACVVSNSTPARVMVRKMKKGAMAEVEGLKVKVTDVSNPDFLSSFISSPFKLIIFFRKGFSQAYILISLMALISSEVLVTLLSMTLTTF